jgi:hypothetical protein
MFDDGAQYDDEEDNRKFKNHLESEVESSALLNAGAVVPHGESTSENESASEGEEESEDENTSESSESPITSNSCLTNTLQCQGPSGARTVFDAAQNLRPDRRLELQDILMRRFVEGEDASHFNYEEVDMNEDFDVGVEMERDAEERYFDDD